MKWNHHAGYKVSVLDGFDKDVRTFYFGSHTYATQMATDSQVKVCVQFSDLYNLLGGAGVKVSIAFGHRCVEPGSLADTQAFWIPSEQLVGRHVFDHFKIWTKESRKSGRPTREGFRAPRPHADSDPDADWWQDSFNAMKGSIAVFITPGTLTGPGDHQRQIFGTDPPSQNQWLVPDTPRVIRYDWHERMVEHEDTDIVHFINQPDTRFASALAADKPKSPSNPDQTNRRSQRWRKPVPKGSYLDHYETDKDEDIKYEDSSEDEQMFQPENPGKVEAETQPRDSRGSKSTAKNRQEPPQAREVQRPEPQAEASATIRNISTKRANVITISDDEDNKPIKRERRDSLNKEKPSGDVEMSFEDDGELIDLELRKVALLQAKRRQQLREQARLRQSVQ